MVVLTETGDKTTKAEEVEVASEAEIGAAEEKIEQAGTKSR